MLKTRGAEGTLTRRPSPAGELLVLLLKFLFGWEDAPERDIPPVFNGGSTPFILPVMSSKDGMSRAGEPEKLISSTCPSNVGGVRADGMVGGVSPGNGK